MKTGKQLRFLFGLFLALVCFSAFSANAYAADSETGYEVVGDEAYQEDFYDEIGVVEKVQSASSAQASPLRTMTSALSVEKTINEYLVEALTEMKTSISISSYGIHKSDISSIYQSIVSSNPRLFYLSGGFSYNYSTSTGNVTTIFPKFTDTVENIKLKKVKFDAAVQKALDSIPDELSDVEKVLAANDYIVYNTRYSTAYTTAYGVFVEGRAQCKGYTKAFRLLMQELGIECIQTGNASHVWNMVRLDGDWYHVDTTWNDPTPNHLGRVHHTNLLCSDEVFASNGHSSWSSGSPRATNTQYDTAFWRSCYSRMIYMDGLWYYTTGRGGYVKRYIKSYDFKTGEIKSIHSYTATWTSSGGAWVHNSYLGEYDGRLYYNGAKGIYSILPDGSDNQTVVSESLSGYSRIYEMQIKDNVLTYRIKTAPNNSTYTQKVIYLTDDGSLMFPVTFDAGIEDYSYIIPAADGGTVESPSDTPERDGYVFLGWQYNGDDFDFSTPITESITLTANWRKTIPLESLIFSTPSLSLYTEDEKQLEVTINPADADIGMLMWESSNDNVAVVDSNGMVYAVSPGTAVITVYIELDPATDDGEIIEDEGTGDENEAALDENNGAQRIFAACIVTVSEAPEENETELSFCQRLLAFIKKIIDFIIGLFSG